MTDPTPTPEPRQHGPSDGCGELLWEHMSADPSFNEEMRQAEAELADGRGVPFREECGADPTPPPGVEEVTRLYGPQQDEAIRLLLRWLAQDEPEGSLTEAGYGELVAATRRFLAAPPPAEQPAVDPGRILDEEEAAFADRILARLSPEPEDA